MDKALYAPCRRYKRGGCEGPTCWVHALRLDAALQQVPVEEKLFVPDRTQADPTDPSSMQTVEGLWDPPAERGSYQLRVVAECSVIGGSTLTEYNHAYTDVLTGLIDRAVPQLVSVTSTSGLEPG